MRHFLFGMIGCALIFGAMCHAQTATDLNEGCRLERDTTSGDYTLSWWGKNARTYFIQQSEDLVTWNYMPVIESGAEEVTEYGFDCTGQQRMFFRLRHTDAATGGNPDTADFDGDGLSNLDEVGEDGTHTDPLVADTDGDGFNDGVEFQIGTDPNAAAANPLTLGQSMLTTITGLWTAYQSAMGSGTYSQQVSAYQAALWAQTDLEGLLAMAADLMPGSQLMDPVQVALDGLPATLPQTPPDNSPGKTWFKVWRFDARAGSEGIDVDTHAEVYSGGSYTPIFSNEWQDHYISDPPMDMTVFWAQKRHNFEVAGAGSWAHSQLATLISATGRTSEPTYSYKWGSDEELAWPQGRIGVNPGGDLNGNPPGDGTTWVSEEWHDMATIEVERAVPFDREFLFLAVREKEYLNQEKKIVGTVKFKVATNATTPTIEISSGVSASWCRERSGGMLELGLNETGPFPWGIDVLEGKNPYFVAYEQWDVVPLEIVVPEFTAEGAGTGKMVPAYELHVAKMEDSLDANDILDIDADPDRFYVRISGLEEWAETVSIKLATVDNPKPEKYDDDETEIGLEPVVDEPGVWMTKSMVLVSDDEDDLLGDDEDSTNYGLDDEQNDRTHKVQLKGNVKIAAIKINGIEVATDLKTPVPADASLNIEVFNMSDSSVSASTVLDEIDIANERLAQIGVYVVADPDGESILIPDPDRARSLSESVVNTSSFSTYNFLDIYGTLGNINDVQVFYVKDAFKLGGPLIGGFAVQETFQSRREDVPLDRRDANTIFIKGPIHPVFTLAHEIVHLLTQRRHYGGPEWDSYESSAPVYKKLHALMNGAISTPNFVGGTKRLHRREVDDMWRSCKLLRFP